MNCITLKCPTLTLLCLALAPTLHAQSYRIDSFTIDGGGGMSVGGAFTVSGVIGQPDAGRMSGGNYSVDGGFWGIISAVPTDDAPELGVILTRTNTVIIAWPAASTGFTLQQNSAPGAANWVKVTNSINAAGSEQFVIVSPTEGSRYYRLTR